MVLLVARQLRRRAARPGPSLVHPKNPSRFPEIEAGIRRALPRRFPYGVYFVVGSDAVVVIAVLHMHRHRDTWKARKV